MFSIIAGVISSVLVRQIRLAIFVKDLGSMVSTIGSSALSVCIFTFVDFPLESWAGDSSAPQPPLGLLNLPVVALTVHESFHLARVFHSSSEMKGW